MTPTIRDVSKKANVSIATVSRVLNNLPGYSEDTKKKVIKAISELGYQPNQIARGLINKRTHTLGVLLPTVSSLFSSLLLAGIEKAAQSSEYSVFVCNTDKNGSRTMKTLQVLAEKQVDGILFASEQMNEEYYGFIQAAGIPTVLVATYSYRYPLPYVKVDDRQAAYLAVQHLLQRGHRQIAMISGTKSDPIAGVPRIEGYKQALSDYGADFSEDQLVYGDFHFASGYAAMERLIAGKSRVTAVFAASDEMAAGALSAAYRHNIKVPDQLSIIGYDNTPLAEMTAPPLTTVSQPLLEMGRLAAEMLFEQIKSGKNPENRIVPSRVIERYSVRSL